jgi:hypothetical protein
MELYVLGMSSEIRDGNEVDALASIDCRTAFGTGARWATSKDAIVLPLHPSVSPFASGFGWVQPYFLGVVDGTSVPPKLLDFSGLSGSIAQLACGPDGRFPWDSQSSDHSGLIAHAKGLSVAFLPCNARLPVLCVGPLSH